MLSNLTHPFNKPHKTGQVRWTGLESNPVVANQTLSPGEIAIKDGGVRTNATYFFGTPTVGVVGRHYRLCWAHNPRDHTDHKFQVDGNATLAGPFKQSVADYEVLLLRSALQRTRFNQSKAASLLELTYDQFRGLMRKHQEALAADK